MQTPGNSIGQTSKLLVKCFVIGAMILLLLVPAWFVQNLVREREERQKEAVAEVSSKWAGRQNITGPVLVIPYEEKTVTTDGKLLSARHHLYMLPGKLIIKGAITPQKKHRGIYDVMLYSSGLDVSGHFLPLSFTKMKLDPSTVLWSEAYLCMSLSDSRGLKEEVRIAWKDSIVTLTPAFVNNAVMKDGFMAPVAINPVDLDSNIGFSTKINLNGSEQLSFTPVGKETIVEVQSEWPDPSFTGSQLPDLSDISVNGFMAKWRSLSHTRNFPQEWKDASYNLEAAAFNVDLFVPVNGYQKTMRSVKYAILCILLTFTAFFLIETTHKKSVHPIQYGLIGFALILFYTLLLSFSEYIGFNAAYAIAAFATIGLITWFVKGLLGSSRLSVFLSLVLVLLYSYVFTILQLQDYALLLGSIGLFITLAIVMHFSKKVKW